MILSHFPEKLLERLRPAERLDERPEEYRLEE